MRSRKFARVGITLVLLFVLFVSSTTGVALASNNALPGDPLYFVDTTIEGIQLALADDEGDVELLNQFANERVAEIQALIEAGRQEDIPAAVQSFQNTNQQLGEAIGNLDPDARGEQILARIAEAHQTRTETLNGLLNQVPEQAQQGIQNALEAGPPDHVGGPNTDNNGNGPPEDRGGGQPEDVGGGKPEGVGGGPPEGKGNPNNQPGCNENRPDDPGAQGNGAADEHGNNENQGNGPPDCEGEGQEPTDTVGDE